jgi:hypothetical protein
MLSQARIAKRPGQQFPLRSMHTWIQRGEHINRPAWIWASELAVPGRFQEAAAYLMDCLENFGIGDTDCFRGDSDYRSVSTVEVVNVEEAPACDCVPY